MARDERDGEFHLEFDPKPSGNYEHGYWYCYAEPGYDGSGATAMDAMAECILAMSKELKATSVARAAARS